MALDFFLWGYVPSVYVSTGWVDTADLKHQITPATATVKPQMPSHMWNEDKYRLDICRVIKTVTVEIF
jgi:hypothetical protein